MLSASWVALGPGPEDNGGTQNVAAPVSGRVTGIVADPSNADIVYLAAADGGVWKTTNATNANPTWAPLTDDQATLAMGAIALAPSNSSIIYAGTGEANNSGDSLLGKGILKSTDGGSTWTLLGSSVFNQTSISRIVVDPSNANIVYAAVDGIGTNDIYTGNVGVWKSTDGGSTWTNTTAGLTGIDTNYDDFSDLVMDPNNDQILYTAVWSPANTDTGGEGVYETTNGGTSWTLLSGLPSGAAVGRTDLVIAPSSPSTIYVLMAGTGQFGSTGYGNLFEFEKSTDGGSTWTDLTANVPGILDFGQGWYDLSLAVNPGNANIVYAGGSSNGGYPGLIESTDGGNTWSDITGGANGTLGPHTDSHAMAFDANGRLLEGDDGGIFRLDNSTPGSTAWTDLNGNLNTIQFYSIALNATNANIAYGASQDNGTAEYTGSTAWNEVDGGDGGVVLEDFSNPSTVYHTYSGFEPGFLVRSDNGGSTWTSVTNGFNFYDSSNFYPPVVMDPSNSSRLVAGSDHIYETTNKGTSWTELGGTFYSNIDNIGLAASDTNTIYASSAGYVYVTTNHGTSWTQTTPDANPTVGLGYITYKDIIVDPSSAAIAYAVLGNPSDYTGGGKVWMTTNDGASWTNITGDLPDVSVNAIVLDSRSGTLYIGTDQGVYSSTNGGTNWTLFGTGLPNADVMSLQLNTSYNVLAAGTHGRGLWEISLASSSFTASVSGTTLQIQDSSGGDNTVIRLKAGDSSTLEVLNDNVLIGDFAVSSISNITVNLTGGNNLLTIDDTNGDPVPTGGLSYTGGPNNLLTVNYAADSTARTITLDSTTVSGNSFGTITGQSAGVIEYRYSDTSGVTLDTGTAADTLNVLSTGSSLSLNDAGSDSVYVGSKGSSWGGTMANINGTVDVYGPGSTFLYLDDSGDTTGRMVTMNDGSLTGLSPAAIDWTPSPSSTGGVTYFLVGGGSGGNTFTVNNTSNFANYTYLETGSGNDAVNIYATTGGLDVNNVGGQDTTDVGVGSLANLQGYVDVFGNAGTTSLIVDDSLDSTARTATLTSTQVTGLGNVGFINYGLNVSALTIDGGTKGSTFNIQGTAAGTPVTVNGGAAADTFNIGDASNTLGGIQSEVTINGGSGSNTLNVKDQGSSSGESYTLSSTELMRFGDIIAYSHLSHLNVYASNGGNDSLTLLSPVPTVATTFNGGTGTNTLQGANVTNTWTITKANGGTLGKVTFNNFQTLIGGTASDTFRFSGANGSISGTISGGGGTTNKLDYSKYTGGAVTVNVQTSTAPLIDGGASGGFSGINSVAGNSSFTANTLIGPDKTNVWTISGNNAGKVNTFSFTGMPNLVGGTGVDTFKFTSPTASKVLSIDGGGAPPNQGDWLNYAAFNSSSTVNVNLANGSATNVNGGANDSITGIQNVIGSASGTNNLTGDSQGNILIGGSGTNTLVSGGGNNLMIGGSGHGSITGGAGEDIEIAGTTTYSDATTAGQESLMAILAELQSADTFAQKVSDLINGNASGGGSDLNGKNTLTWGVSGAKVKASVGAFTLTGNSSETVADWFFSNASSTVSGFVNGVDEHNNNALGVF